MKIDGVCTLNITRQVIVRIKADGLLKRGGVRESCILCQESEGVCRLVFPTETAPFTRCCYVRRICTWRLAREAIPW